MTFPGLIKGTWKIVAILCTFLYARTVWACVECVCVHARAFHHPPACVHMCVSMRDCGFLWPWMPVKAAGNTLQLIKYLRLHLIQDFMRSLFLWPRAVGRRLPEREERGKTHERPEFGLITGARGSASPGFEAACAAELMSASGNTQRVICSL